MKIKRHQTYRSFVLYELLKGKHLNQKEFLKFGTWRLSAIIDDLQKLYGIIISRYRIPNAGGAVAYYMTAEEIRNFKSRKCI